MSSHKGKYNQREHYKKKRAKINGIKMTLKILVTRMELNTFKTFSSQSRWKTSFRLLTVATSTTLKNTAQFCSSWAEITTSIWRMRLNWLSSLKLIGTNSKSGVKMRYGYNPGIFMKVGIRSPGVPKVSRFLNERLQPTTNFKSQSPTGISSATCSFSKSSTIQKYVW